jgi:hypothetical protein
MSEFHITSFIYPDKGPVWFLLFMVFVIALTLWAEWRKDK